MEYQKIINFLDIHQISYLNLEQKIGLNEMINREECIIPTVTLDSKLQCLSLVYEIIVMRTYLLKEE